MSRIISRRDLGNEDDGKPPACRRFRKGPVRQPARKNLPAPSVDGLDEPVFATTDERRCQITKREADRSSSPNRRRPICA